MADYMVNVSAYKKSCVNKAKPLMHCNGKCQMIKKMKKQVGENEANVPAPKFNETEVVLSSKSFFPSVIVILISNIPSFNSYTTYFSSNYIGSIFHPPGLRL
jgi:hypothetical protein